MATSQPANQSDEPHRASQSDQSDESVHWASLVAKCDLKNLHKVLSSIPSKFRWHENVASIVLDRNALLLRRAWQSIRDHTQLVRRAVQKNGLALRWASQRLQSDPETVCLAVQQCGEAIKYASKAARSRENCLHAVMNDPEALLMISKKYRSDKQFVMAAVVNEGLMLEYAVYCDDDVINASIKEDIRAMWFVKKLPQSQDAKQLGEMVAKYPYLLQCACLENQVEVCLAVVAKNGLALKHASLAMRQNLDVVRTAVRQNCLAFEFADKSVKDNFEFVLHTVSVWPELLRWASRSLRNDVRVVQAAVSKDYTAFEFAGKEIWKSYPYDDFVRSCPTDQLANNIYAATVTSRCFYLSSEERKFFAGQASQPKQVVPKTLGSPSSVLEHVGRLLSKLT